MIAESQKGNCSPFSDYAAYVSKLKRLAAESSQTDDWSSRVEAALNGQASVELRRVSPLETRRKFGAFFTGTALSSKLIDCGIGFDESSVFYDPTCGMGDLLLAAARKLLLRKTLQETLQQWGQQLSGTDIHREFITGARTRLVLLARQRHDSHEVLSQSSASFFPNIRVADGLLQDTLFERASHLLLNPPFGQVTLHQPYNWAGGRITAAAGFVVTALERAKPGTQMLAILPEVLRAGTFSDQWRARVDELAEVKLAKPYGIFDDSADVDVFLLQATRRKTDAPNCAGQWVKSTEIAITTVADFFDVHVGRVVPHRDPETGDEHPYIHPRCVPTWTVMRDFSEFRRHEGLVYKPPFVVIRRTSRPGHPYRATATIIAGKQAVAVENHLIVCEPKDGKFSTCRKLMTQLQSGAVNEFLDARIRCRHLTVGSIAAIPFTTQP